MNLYRIAEGEDEQYIVASSMVAAIRRWKDAAGVEFDPDLATLISDDLEVPVDSSSGTEAPRVEEEMDRLDSENAALRVQVIRLQNSIRWALGEGPDNEGNHFGEPDMMGGKLPTYWWRGPLRKMSEIDG